MRKGLLITTLALAGCLPARAQQPVNVRARTLAMDSVPISLKANFRDADLARAPQSVVTVTPIFDRSSQGSWVDSCYELTETPFVQQVHVPVISLAGGRFQLAGYYRMLSAENFQLGLPGGGSQDAWSVSAQSHVAVIAPRLDQGAGFSVSLHLHGAGLREMHLHGYQTVNRAIAFVRGS